MRNVIGENNSIPLSRLTICIAVVASLAAVTRHQSDINREEKEMERTRAEIFRTA